MNPERPNTGTGSAGAPMNPVTGAIYRHAKRQLAFARTLKVIGDLDGMRAYVNAARDNWRRAKFFRR